MEVSRRQVLAFRVARHHLAARLPSGAAAGAATVGLQDTPPGTAGIALAARAEAVPEDLEGLVIVPSVRGAPLAVSPEDLAVFTAGLAPPDEEAARVLVGSATRTLGETPALEALDRVGAAVADALAAGPLERDPFHQALRERLPGELLWECRGCGTRHVHPSLWRATGVRGVLAIVGREGRTAVFGAPPAVTPPRDPGAELARRFLTAYGPARPALLAGWAGIAPAHARALWERAGELAEASIEGRKGWVLASDAGALADPPAASGVRLLPNLDPLLTGRDREVVLPDEAERKQVWKVLGGPGVVLVDGEPTGRWRGARKGRKLVVTLEGTGGLDRDALTAEAARLAPFRGAERAEVVLT